MMKNVMNFLSAALPWICIGLLLAIFFAQSAQRKKGNKSNENYSTEGLALGMCFGVALGSNTGIGLTLGMLAGFVVGSCIEKKKNDDDRSEG